MSVAPPPASRDVERESESERERERESARESTQPDWYLAATAESEEPRDTESPEILTSLVPHAGRARRDPPVREYRG